MMSRYHDTMTRTAGNVLELGAAIRDARKRRGWTQAELADKAGVSRQLLTAVERGKRPGAAVSGVLAVARALGMGLALAPLASAPGRLPRSTSVRSWRETPALSASSAWVQPLRLRASRIAAPSSRTLPAVRVMVSW